MPEWQFAGLVSPCCIEFLCAGDEACCGALPGGGRASLAGSLLTQIPAYGHAGLLGEVAVIVVVAAGRSQQGTGDARRDADVYGAGRIPIAQ